MRRRKATSSGASSVPGRLAPGSMTTGPLPAIGAVAAQLVATAPTLEANWWVSVALPPRKP